jgi:hypothetical protein
VEHPYVDVDTTITDLLFASKTSEGATIFNRLFAILGHHLALTSAVS